MGSLWLDESRGQSLAGGEGLKPLGPPQSRRLCPYVSLRTDRLKHNRYFYVSLYHMLSAAAADDAWPPSPLCDVIMRVSVYLT